MESLGKTATDLDIEFIMKRDDTGFLWGGVKAYLNGKCIMSRSPNPVNGVEYNEVECLLDLLTILGYTVHVEDTEEDDE